MTLMLAAFADPSTQMCEDDPFGDDYDNEYDLGNDPWLVPVAPKQLLLGGFESSWETHNAPLTATGSTPDFDGQPITIGLINDIADDESGTTVIMGGGFSRDESSYDGYLWMWVDTGYGAELVVLSDKTVTGDADLLEWGDYAVVYAVRQYDPDVGEVFTTPVNMHAYVLPDVGQRIDAWDAAYTAYNGASNSLLQAAKAHCYNVYSQSVCDGYTWEHSGVRYWQFAQDGVDFEAYMAEDNRMNDNQHDPEQGNGHTRAMTGSWLLMLLGCPWRQCGTSLGERMQCNQKCTQEGKMQNNGDICSCSWASTQTSCTLNSCSSCVGAGGIMSAGYVNGGSDGWTAY